MEINICAFVPIYSQPLNNVDLNYVCVCVCVSLSVVSNSVTAMDYSPPGSSVHGILQARILGCIAVPFSRVASWAGIEPVSPALAGRFFTTSTTWTTWVHLYINFFPINIVYSIRLYSRHQEYSWGYFCMCRKMYRSHIYYQWLPES